MNERMPALLPIIGVIACGREVEGEAAQATRDRYLEAVFDYAAAAPLMIPTNQPAANAAAIVARLDAMLLTGSNSNIDPVRYGSANAVRQPVDPGRDIFSTALILAAVSAGKPILGVCRGLQEINVAFGGTLRDMRSDADQVALHHAPDGASLETMFAHEHGIEIVPDTPLAQIAGTTGFRVNSVHFQTIYRLGTGLEIAAISSDGIVEAVFATSTPGPVIAVQWHAEWRPAGRPHDLALWAYLGEIARAQLGQARLDRA
ncbi:MAG: gamma-glutamyl-gamma-aminobutyrate hydrolase family protein [Devosia sp.]